MTRVRVLITGCSAGGKSTLLEELAHRGWATVSEPGRRVIAAERARDGDGYPWDNAERFAVACLEMAERDWQRAGDAVTFFDRGVVDAAFALRRIGRPAPGRAVLARCPYDRVILAPPWRALFEAKRDPERRHGFDEASVEFEDIAAGLAAMGQATDRFPRTTVNARADWVEKRLAAG